MGSPSAVVDSSGINRPDEQRARAVMRSNACRTISTSSCLNFRADRVLAVSNDEKVASLDQERPARDRVPTRARKGRTRRWSRLAIASCGMVSRLVASCSTWSFGHEYQSQSRESPSRIGESLMFIVAPWPLRRVGLTIFGLKAACGRVKRSMATSHSRARSGIAGDFTTVPRYS